MALLLEKRFDNSKTYVTFSLLAFVSGFVSSIYGLAGYLFFPLTAALFSALFLFDKTAKKILSIGVAVSVLAVDSLITVIFNRVYTEVCLLSILIALIISLTLGFKKTKAFSAAVSTCILCLGFLIYIYLVGAYAIGTANVAEVFNYYNDSVASIREQFVKIMMDSAGSVTSTIDITADLLSQAFDMFLQSIIAYVIVAAYLLVGIAHKISSKLLWVFAEDKKSIIARRFFPNVVFAYFYLISVVLMFFVSGTDIFVVTLSNLVIVFKFVYAYLGLRIVRVYLLTRVHSNFAVYIILIATIILFSSVAIEFLAVIGAVSCIIATRSNLPKNIHFNEK